ncbi:MAG: PAS domain-containing protein [bacterium]
MNPHKVDQKDLNKQFAYVIDKIKSGFIFFDKAGNILYYNQHVSKLFNKKDTDLHDENIISLLDLREYILDHLEFQQNIEFTKTFNIDNNEVLFNISITRLDNESKDIYGYLIVNSLSSMEKQVDDLLMRELDTQRLIDESLIGIFMVDSKHRITRTNNTFCNLLAYKPYELHNKFTWSILKDYTKETIEKANKDMVHATNIVKTDFIKKDGGLVRLGVMGKGGKIKGEPVMIYFVDTFPKE